MRGSSLATGRALATSRSDPRETPLGAGTPQEKEGSPPGPRFQRLRPGRGGLGEVEEAPSKRRRKRLPSDPRKVDRDQPHVAPPKPVSLTKATAARAHHLVSPNPSLKHKTTTTQLLSFMKPSPGIKFGVAATTTRHAEYRYTAGGRRGLRLASPPHLRSPRRLPKLTRGGGTDR